MTTILNTITDCIDNITDYFYPKEEPPLFVSANQGDAYGYALREGAETVFNVINDKKEHGVIFKKEKLRGSLYGGACSALAFNFIKAYLDKKTEHPLWSTKKVVKHLSNTTAKGATPIHRVQQVAFNCIAKDPSTHSPDFRRAKIQSLANFYDLKIIKTSEEIDLESTTSHIDIAKLANKLVNGVYLVRIIKPSDNDKGEVQGHSMAYIQTDEGNFFYDPSRRITEINNADKEQHFQKFLPESYYAYGVHQLRFYQVVPNTSNIHQLIPDSSETIESDLFNRNIRVVAA